MSQIKFTATKLVNKGKRGNLRPDETGYYTLPIGALNAYNSIGHYYTLEGAKQLFESSSIFMRRIGNGNLSGELGHPSRLPGMKEEEFLGRILRVAEENIVCHFKEVWLDEDFGRNNPGYNNNAMVAIMAKVKPSGPRGPALEQSLNNPDENVCFSIRALTRDYYHRGQTYRVLTSICTFDNVREPGINIANKWDSPSLESINPSLESLNDIAVTRRIIEKIAHSDNQLIACESSKAIALEALHHIDRVVELPKIKPLYANW